MSKNIIKYTIAIAFLVPAAGTSLAQHRHDSQSNTTSPYIQQLDSSIRGLNSEEIENLINGKGAGYARMAELNSYPGPQHILDLASELNLSPQQSQKIRQVFEQMKSEATGLGKNILIKEKQLSDAFASERITEATLTEKTNELGQLYGELRNIHLQAHLRITPLLTSEQIEKYDQLRGYES